jgi:hypothetical protein
MCCHCGPGMVLAFLCGFAWQLCFTVTLLLVTGLKSDVAWDSQCRSEVFHFFTILHVVLQ